MTLNMSSMPFNVAQLKRSTQKSEPKFLHCDASDDKCLMVVVVGMDGTTSYYDGTITVSPRCREK